VKTEKSSQNQQKVSKIVRNRTILGSFPLFYKLSQSLSSLNSGGVSVENEGTSKSTFQTKENYSKIGREPLFGDKGGISSLHYPKSTATTTRLPIRPGATLGGAININSSIITDYDMGCFYIEDSNMKDR
jgi:hypothetical protein